MELFAANLKKRAGELGISNAEVARRAGLSERRYGNYVSGRREPDLATLVKIASVLATTPNALLMQPAEGGEKLSEQITHARIIAALSALRDDDLERLAVMIEALATARI